MGVVKLESGRWKATMTIDRIRHDSGSTSKAGAEKAYAEYVDKRNAIPGYTGKSKGDSLSKTDGFSAAAAGYLRSNWVMGAL